MPVTYVIARSRKIIMDCFMRRALIEAIVLVSTWVLTSTSTGLTLRMAGFVCSLRKKPSPSMMPHFCHLVAPSQPCPNRIQHNSLSSAPSFSISRLSVHRLFILGVWPLDGDCLWWYPTLCMSNQRTTSPGGVVLTWNEELKTKHEHRIYSHKTHWLHCPEQVPGSAVLESCCANCLESSCI